MTTKHSSGLDFSDRAPTSFDHPDIAIVHDGGPAYLRRNKTEHRRLQGLMRSEPLQVAVESNGPDTFKSKWDRWMVNDGGRRLFFAIWIFLQLVVLVFGIANYQLKDGFVNARAEFGITYRESQWLILRSSILTHSQPSHALLHSFYTLMLHLYCFPSVGTSSLSSVAPHSTRSFLSIRASPFTRQPPGPSFSGLLYIFSPTW